MKSILQKSGAILLPLTIGIWGVMILRGPNGLAALAEKRHEIELLQDKNSSMAAENAHKRDRIEELKHNRSVQEQVVRERLKLVRPNETQFILPKK